MNFGIVVPCFNEARRWNPEYWNTLLGLPIITWLFVNDGSTDQTEALVTESLKGTSAELLTLDPNKGKAEAVRQGLTQFLTTNRNLDAVGFMDADGAFNAMDVLDLTDVYRRVIQTDPRVDAVWSSRVALAGRNIQRSSKRHYIGRAVATVVSIGQPAMPYDTQSGLKLFRTSEILSRVLADRFETRWMFELEMLARWQQTSGRSMVIWEEPLNYWHDVPGSKISGAETLRIARELWKIKRIQGRVNSD